MKNKEEDNEYYYLVTKKGSNQIYEVISQEKGTVRKLSLWAKIKFLLSA